ERAHVCSHRLLGFGEGMSVGHTGHRRFLVCPASGSHSPLVGESRPGTATVPHYSELAVVATDDLVAPQPVQLLGRGLEQPQIGVATPRRPGLELARTGLD